MAGWGPWAFVVAGVLAVLHAWTLRGWSRAWRKALISGVGAEPRAVDWTVVIPAHNESQHLGNVLDDLAEQELQVHILVVDDHSTDGTASLATSHQLTMNCISNDFITKSRNFSCYWLAVGWWSFHDG